MNTKKFRDTGIPIFFVHSGNPYYLKYTLKQACFFNPRSKVYLLGDGSNNKYPLVHHAFMRDYFEGATAFEKVYKQMSTNPYWFELICFQRWFIVRDFCIKNIINELVYLDSDALLYCDASEVFSKFRNFKFTVLDKIGPPYCHFLTGDLIEFCDYIMKMYTDGFLSKRIERIWVEYQKLNLPGGICDMTAFQQFEADFPGSAFELSTIDENGTFCNMNKGESQFVSDKNGYIKVKFKGIQPLGKLKTEKKEVLIRGIEFGGNEKKKIPKYYIGGGYYFYRKKELLYFAIRRFMKILLKIKLIRYLNQIRNYLRAKFRVSL
jgi:hypothetical protein